MVFGQYEVGILKYLGSRGGVKKSLVRRDLRTIRVGWVGLQKTKLCSMDSWLVG